ncbi:hypothetical protein DFA_03969 [Cavenderia fasciculata]|uniref:Uncharacterized protein n=1 Tax=Cavenderia fasciculata TaxID=261658 RepID=F4Q0X4_CACFS|nr:uncharacterized protein DFA_03969 [Cavenderia fasciculata]EGG18475.1 hypothetical protein DFA_03969 [Cavenderia fasciculata]|eukprot:XP_004366379.1 hypothetical protein DFA_03969 [Cavenderia fasciculata]
MKNDGRMRVDIYLSIYLTIYIYLSLPSSALIVRGGRGSAEWTILMIMFRNTISNNAISLLYRDIMMNHIYLLNVKSF